MMLVNKKKNSIVANVKDLKEMEKFLKMFINLNRKKQLEFIAVIDKEIKKNESNKESS